MNFGSDILSNIYGYVNPRERTEFLRAGKEVGRAVELDPFITARQSEAMRRQLTRQLKIELDQDPVNWNLIIDLIQRGANINTITNNGNNAINLATVSIYNDNTEELKTIFYTLLNMNPNTNIEDESGFTPINYAILIGDMNMIHELLANDANINHLPKGESVIDEVVSNDNVKLVEYLLENGLSIEELNMRSGTYDNYTPLIIAIHNDSKKMVKLLLENGVNVNETDDLNRTPLIHAVKLNNVSLVKLLLKYHPDLDHIDDMEGWSALTYAEENRNDIIQRLLLSAGATPQEF